MAKVNGSSNSRIVGSNSWIVPAVLLCGGMIATACGGTTSVIGTPTTLRVTTTTASTVASGPPCQTSGLNIQLTKGLAGGGQEGGIIAFTNKSTTACSLTGYPKVVAKDASGKVLMTASSLVNGYLGGLNGGGSLPSVSLPPGASASAVVEGTDTPNQYYACVSIASLSITPPQSATSVDISAALPSEGSNLPGCAPIQIHPVLPGVTAFGT